MCLMRKIIILLQYVFRSLHYILYIAIFTIFHIKHNLIFFQQIESQKSETDSEDENT